MLKKGQTLSFGVFLFSLIIVVISSISIIFPALILTSVSGSESDIGSFEHGVWAIPFIIINISLLVFAILYYRKKLPDYVVKTINFILNFEISKRLSIILVVIIIGSYVAISYPELYIIESEQWEDYAQRIDPTLKDFPQSFFKDQGMMEKALVKNFLLISSIEVFENVKIIPFLASVALLFLTYFFTVKISGKRFSGILALVVLVQSRTFLEFDTTATYSNFWTLFYLLSLYFVYKKWYLSTPMYILSIFSKPLTIIFLPLTLFFISQAKISKRRKIFVAIPYLVIGILIAVGAMTIMMPKEILFDSSEFLGGFTVWVFQLRYDVVLFTLILPLTIGLYLASRRGVAMADALLILITGMLLSAPLLGGLTGFNIHPYRFMPLLVFFAVGIGLLFGNRSSNWLQYGKSDS